MKKQVGIPEGTTGNKIYLSNEVTGKIHIRIGDKNYWISASDLIEALHHLCK